MRINEILLPKSDQDTDLHKEKQQRIDLLKSEIARHSEMISKDKLDSAHKEVLKAKVRDYVAELKQCMQEDASVTYEVYDTRTGKKVSGPYLSIKRARAAVDRLDNKYGGYRYGHRKVNSVNEAIHTVPLTTKDFEVLKELMQQPIPVCVASIYLVDLISDDDLNSEFSALELKSPNLDARTLIATWLERTMPDQLHRFNDKDVTFGNKAGDLSPIHGYDTTEYVGSNDPLTGNAYGRYKTS